MCSAANAAAQTPVDAGYRDFSFGSSASSTPTGEKPESKVWFNDGTWWGSLFSPSAGHYRIHRFDSSDQSWTDTGTSLDTRETSKADVLWDEASQKLYVASHMFTTSASSSSSSSTWGKLFRYSYNAVTKLYTLDSGFPVDVTRGRSETLTIAKDGNGRLFVTYVQSSRVKINWSLSGDADWGVPVDLPHPTAEISVSSDDISAIAAYPNGDVGLLWSNQKLDKILFTLHRPQDPPALWQPVEVVLPAGVCAGNSCADDHISLKTDQSNRLYAATKTSNESDNQPLNVLSVRNTDGTWTNHVIGLYQHHLTRGVIVLDEQQQLIYFIGSNPESGGAIYFKTSPMNGVSFEPGIGEPLILSDLDDRTNNASSTKQSVSSLTGLLVIASDQDTKRYLHAYLPLGSAPPSPPTAPVGLNAAPVSSTRIALTWTDTSDNETMFRIERMEAGGVFELRQTVGANVTFVEDLNLTPSTAYTYRVYAVNLQGTSAFSNEASATTTGGGTTGNIKAITLENGSLTNPTTGADTVTGTVTIETAQPIKDTFSARIATGSSSLDEVFPAAPDLYLSAYLRLASLPSGDARIILVTNAGSTVGNIVLRSNGRLRLRVGSTTIGSESAPLAVGQTYRIGVHQRAGTGANALIEAFVASGDSGFAAPFAMATSGTWTSNADRVRIGPTTSTAVNAVFDDMRLDSAQMPEPSGAGAQPPVAPQDPTANATSPTSIHLAWVDAASNETAVHVERAPNGSPFEPLTTLAANSTSYDDVNLVPGTTYIYRLRGENNGLFSEYSDQASATTPGNTPGPPAAPSGLSATPNNPSMITLTWTDNSTNETSFDIERSEDGNTFDEIATTAANVALYQDGTVGAGLTYTYRVRASNTDGFSGFSNTDSATTPPVDPGAGEIKAMTFEDGSLTHAVSGADRTSGTSITLETASPLKGAFAARVSGGNSFLEEQFGQADDVYLSFYVRLDAWPTSDVRIALISNQTTSVGNIVLRPTGRLRLRVDSTTVGVESQPLAPGLLYRIGIHQRAGSGGNAVLEGFVAAGDDAFVAPFTATTAGAWTTPADRVRAGSTTASVVQVVIDHVRINSIGMPGPTP